LENLKTLMAKSLPRKALTIPGNFFQTFFQPNALGKKWKALKKFQVENSREFKPIS